MTQRIVITPGEPAGIGPDLLVNLAQHGNPHELIAVADPALLQQRAALLGLPLRLREFDPKHNAKPLAQGELGIAPIDLAEPCTPGQLSVKNSSYVLNTLDHAINLCQRQFCSALVTGPIHKGIINDAKLNLRGLFQGHTEYLAEKCGVKTVVMMLATRGLRVALQTTHLPLRDVASAITAEKLQITLKILHQSLQQQFAIAHPRILVCGLNPHAGEGGHLGHEENDIIIPALESLRQQGLQLLGPLPADTLFTPKVLDQGDAVLAMYHDQGLPVLKYKGFGNAVNITLGLPIIRTSVDHGTALDLVGTGKANIGSLQTAIDTAIEMSTANRHNQHSASKMEPH